MHYARHHCVGEGVVPVDGIEITAEQYRDALTRITSGENVTVIDGVMTFYRSPVYRIDVDGYYIGQSNTYTPGEVLIQEGPPGDFVKPRYVNGAWTEGEDAAVLLQRATDAKCAQIDVERDARIAAGLSYTFSDGAGTVQLRNQRDITNALTVQARGQALVMAGDTVSTVPFRDAENVTHYMAGAQAVTFGATVTDYNTALYQAAWNHKDAVRALATIADVEAYDITAGWPA